MAHIPCLVALPPPSVLGILLPAARASVLTSLLQPLPPSYKDSVGPQGRPGSPKITSPARDLLKDTCTVPFAMRGHVVTGSEDQIRTRTSAGGHHSGSDSPLPPPTSAPPPLGGSRKLSFSTCFLPSALGSAQFLLSCFLVFCGAGTESWSRRLPAQPSPHHRDGDEKCIGLKGLEG